VQLAYGANLIRKMMQCLVANNQIHRRIGQLETCRVAHENFRAAAALSRRILRAAHGSRIDVDANQRLRPEVFLDEGKGGSLAAADIEDARKTLLRVEQGIEFEE
jgi:hypothetical protein